jgi:hypothetical protein
VKYIRQKAQTDCGIACLAMLAGVSYPKAKALLFGPSHNATCYTTKDEMRDALRYFGVITSKRLVRCKRLDRLGRDALLRTNVLNNGNWHWVVWDAAQGRILDPLPYKRGLRPYSGLVVLRRLRNPPST